MRNATIGRIVESCFCQAGHACTRNLRNASIVMQIFIPSRDPRSARDYRLTWAAALLALDAIKADPTLFRGWDIRWTVHINDAGVDTELSLLALSKLMLHLSTINETHVLFGPTNLDHVKLLQHMVASPAVNVRTHACMEACVYGRVHL
jgi:hypothetical protein